MPTDDNNERKLPIGTPIQRRQGCWNCRHWNNQELARLHWSTQRLSNLKQAKEISNVETEGEDCQTVKNIRRMVDQVDHAVARGVFGICLIGKSEADFCHHAFLCAGWSSCEGAKEVMNEGLDKLPEELKEE